MSRGPVDAASFSTARVGNWASNTAACLDVPPRRRVPRTTSSAEDRASSLEPVRCHARGRSWLANIAWMSGTTDLHLDHEAGRSRYRADARMSIEPRSPTSHRPTSMPTRSQREQRRPRSSRASASEQPDRQALAVPVDPNVTLAPSSSTDRLEATGRVKRAAPPRSTRGRSDVWETLHRSARYDLAPASTMPQGSQPDSAEAQRRPSSRASTGQASPGAQLMPGGASNGRRESASRLVLVRLRWRSRSRAIWAADSAARTPPVVLRCAARRHGEDGQPRRGRRPCAARAPRRRSDPTRPSRAPTRTSSTARRSRRPRSREAAVDGRPPRPSAGARARRAPLGRRRTPGGSMPSRPPRRVARRAAPRTADRRGGRPRRRASSRSGRAAPASGPRTCPEL